jgi:uncharacterized membrane protein YeaQ/YmgE (transglycosylase-associated protein family)
VGLISWILVGVAAALLAKWIVPDSVPGGPIVAVLLELPAHPSEGSSPG